MWRFILITFGFLGFAFWELSGGANYAPRDNSLQAQANRSAQVTVAQVQNTTTTSQSTSQQPQNGAELSTLQDTTGDRFEITLASVQADLRKNDALPEGANKVSVLTEPKTAEDAAVVAALEEAQEDVREVWPGAIELFEQQTARQELRKEAEAAARAAMDVRYITGTVVNMRGGPGTEYQKVTSLTEGTEVAVLQSPGNGWLELQVVDTGETGWMADWLVSAAAN